MRRFALFGATVLFRCTLLVVCGYRMIGQDRELAAKYADEEQPARTLQQNQSRLAELEKWKRTAAEDSFAGPQIVSRLRDARRQCDGISASRAKLTKSARVTGLRLGSVVDRVRRCSRSVALEKLGRNLPALGGMRLP